MDKQMEIQGTSATDENSIFRAPMPMRYHKESDFEPKLVSIGPYHHGRESFKHMEELKLQCVPYLRKKQAVGGTKIDRVPIKEFMAFERYARDFYKEKFDHNEVDFVEMLVIDSCFIIRVILSLSQEVQESMAFLDVNIKEVRSDLLLLENQIPLFFINEVYQWLLRGSHTSNQILPPFETVLEQFIRLDMPYRTNHGDIPRRAAHLLDLYWRCCSSSEKNEQLANNFNSDQEQPSSAEIHFSFNKPKVIANATALHQIAGIEFRNLYDEGHDDGLEVGSKGVTTRFERMRDHRVSKQTRLDLHPKPTSLFDVNFSNGIMWMPCLKIDSSKTTLFVNLIAFENSIKPEMRTFSTYIRLMDELIDSEKDVELLQQCGVVYNTLSSHKMAATFFNDIGNYCFINSNKNRSSGLYRNVQKYYNSNWNHSRASLRQNYFSSPWAGISVVAGVTLLILSALQTFYTIYAFYTNQSIN